MANVALDSNEIKLLKERARVERGRTLETVPNSQRWTLYCMGLNCDWGDCGPFQTGEAARTVAEFHSESTGHPVKMRASVDFEAGIVRARRVR